MYESINDLRTRQNWRFYRENDIPAWANQALGQLFAVQTKLVEAEAMYKRALAGHEKALGADHTSPLRTFNSLGNLYLNQRKFAEAEAMYERALAEYDKALGAEHASSLGIVNNLGNLYYSQGKLAEAEAMYERALAGRVKALGSEHTDTLMTVNNLGALYRKGLYLCIFSVNRSQARLLFYVSKEDTALKLIASVSRVWIKWHQARNELAEHIGHMLLWVGRLQDAVVAFEQQISRSHKGVLHSKIVCDGCDHPIRLPSIRFICVSCNDIDLCSTCRQDYERKGRLDRKLPICRNHAFLAVPRDIWSTLPSGVVSADGTTAEDWMNRLLVTLTKSSDEMVCH